MNGEATETQTPDKTTTGVRTSRAPAPKRNRTRSPEKRERTRAAMPDPNTDAPAPAPTKRKTNRYNLKDEWFLVRLNAPTDPQEEKDQFLGHNGMHITVKKGKWTPVNGVFVDKLAHAEQPFYSNEPGEAREAAGFKSRFTFQYYPISEQDYNKLRTIAKQRDLTPQEVNEATGINIRN